MLAFDIYNRVRENLKGYTTYVIPSLDKSEIDIENRDKLFYHPLSELTFKDAPDYTSVSMEEIEKYIFEFYTTVLSKLDPKEMYQKLNGSCLTSNERTDSLAKRHIVSEWLKLYTDININEVGTGENNSVINLDTPEFIGPMLEKVIRKNVHNMRGFSSLKALYLFEEGEKLEEKALEFEYTDIDSYVSYMQAASYRRCEADEEERKYKLSKKQKVRAKHYGIKG